MAENTSIELNQASRLALEAYNIDLSSWGVHVQPYSFLPAKFVYTALLNPHDTKLGLDLPSSGDLTHVYSTSGGTYIYSQKVNSSTGNIDYEKVEEKVSEFKPKLICLGGSAYPRDWDYKKIRDIADKCGAIILCDMTHASGLVAAQEAADPFEYCDVVTTTYNISGEPSPRLIFYRKGPKPPKEGQAEGAVYDFEDKINCADFPALEGDLHNHPIGVLAVGLLQTMFRSFKDRAKKVKANATAIGDHLMSEGYKLVTDNYLVLLDVGHLGLTGNMVEKVCDLFNITVKKNADSSPLAPEVVRIGSPAMTSRGLVEEDFKQIGEFLHRAIQITSSMQKEFKNVSKDFNKGLGNEIEQLKLDVEKFSRSFDMPGISLA